MVVVCGDLAMRQGLGGRWCGVRAQATRRLGPIILKFIIESIKDS